jgi:hypothetical protein
MEFNFNPRDLTAAEREHVAAFISGWPALQSTFGGYPTDAPETTDKVRTEDSAPVGACLTFGGKTEVELLADEHAADMQPTDPVDDNTDKAAAQAAFTPSATPDRDGEGLPWDRRIHSSSKAINADGRWRIARNVAPEMIESVKAELRALVAAPITIEHAGVTTQSEAVPQIIAPPPPAAEPVAVVPPPPSVVVSVDPASPGTDLNIMFTTLLRDAGQAVVAQRITSADLTAICVKHGVANVGLLASRKDLVPQIDSDFRALLASKVQP